MLNTNHHLWRKTKRRDYIGAGCACLRVEAGLGSHRKEGVRRRQDVLVRGKIIDDGGGFRHAQALRFAGKKIRKPQDQGERRARSEGRRANGLDSATSNFSEKEKNQRTKKMRSKKRSTMPKKVTNLMVASLLQIMQRNQGKRWWVHRLKNRLYEESGKEGR